MRIGIQLPYPTSITAPTAEAALELARVVEELGFDGCGVPDHPFPLIDGGRSPAHHVLDPFVFLAAIASVTTTVRLITMATVLPYRNPFITAKAAASVDYISKGRLILSTATGYLAGEFDALGSDFARRSDVTDEAIAAIKMAWSGEPVHGVFCGNEVAGNTMLPRPVSMPHPPIWMAGNSMRALRRAVAHCDGWAPYEAGRSVASATRTSPLSLKSLQERLAQMSDLLSEAGRPADRFDVCVLRENFDWQAPPTLWGAEMNYLHDLGVTWSLLRLPADVEPSRARHLLASVAAALRG